MNQVLVWRQTGSLNVTASKLDTDTRNYFWNLKDFKSFLYAALLTNKVHEKQINKMKTFKTQTRANPIPWRGKVGKCKAVTTNTRFVFLQALSLLQKSWNKSDLKAFDSHQWIHLIQKHTGHQKLGRQFITYYFHHISSFFYILRCTTKIKNHFLPLLFYSRNFRTFDCFPYNGNLW